MSFIICLVLCAGFLFECGVLFCVMCVICVLCLIVVPLPPAKRHICCSNNNNNNNNILSRFPEKDN
jgi:hypothetical protein